MSRRVMLVAKDRNLIDEISIIVTLKTRHRIVICGTLSIFVWIVPRYII
jgi:hypothetical protein